MSKKNKKTKKATEPAPGIKQDTPQASDASPSTEPQPPEPAEQKAVTVDDPAAGSESEEAPKEKKRGKKKDLPTLESTQMWSPIRDVKDGIIITKDGNFIMVLEFAPINFLLLPPDEQIAIADAFGAALKTFPNNFQIKVLSRQASVETHIRHLQGFYEKETNEYCRKMQKNSMLQMAQDAQTGVSRRFFISFRYTQPQGLRRATWDEIKSSMYFTAVQISSRLAAEPCNNALLSPIGDSEHVLGILYECMCRAEAESKPFEVKFEDVICAHMAENGFDPSNNDYIPVNDFLAPRKISPAGFKSINIDGKHYAFGYIHRTSYPTRCIAGWLTTLVNMGEGIDLDIWVEKHETRSIMSKLTYSMQLTTSDYMHKANSSADVVELRNKLQAGNYIREGLTNEQNFLYFSIMVTVIGDSEAELKEKYEAVSNTLTAYGLQLKPLNANQDLALKSSLPLCSPEKAVTRFAKRNCLTGDFGAAYPFTSYEINDPRGIPVGKSAINSSPLFLDFFDRHLYTNGNAVICGSSGAGKTYTLQCFALRLRQYHTETIIIAPYKGHEFKPACSAVGGSFINLAPGSPHTVNILEIRKYDNKNAVLLDGEDILQSSILSSKIHQIRTFFTILVPEMTLQEIRILEDALAHTYSKFGITNDNDSLLDPEDPSKYRKMPIFDDLNDELLKQKGADRLIDALFPFIHGSAKTFNGQTNVNLDNPYVVIDVSNMPEALMPVAIFIATDFVYDTIRADRIQRKAVIIDELSRLIGSAGSADAANFVQKLYKTVRAYNAIIISATQDTNDFFALEDGKYGRGILANAKIKLIMKQEPEEVKTLQSLLYLSDAEAQQLIYLARGEGLLIANRNHILVHIEASQTEHDLITTDPEQLAQIIEKRRRQMAGQT